MTEILLGKMVQSLKLPESSPIRQAYLQGVV